ncbi:protein downstream neighbor of son homolog [Pseudopipra pipra]|uniref:protein downstream neighbor of son homolog n=1 Tax=Pseudopipra pipra TaxID=415032 RepID=UPI003138CA71
MAAPAEPGDPPGFQRPPAMLRLKRKRRQRSEPAAAAAAPAPRGPSAPARRNPFCSLNNNNEPQRAAAPQPPAPAGGDPSAAPFWQFLEPACEEKPPGRAEPAGGGDILALTEGEESFPCSSLGSSLHGLHFPARTLLQVGCPQSHSFLRASP